MASDDHPTPSDFDALRSHVPARPRDPAPEDPAPQDGRVSVMEWLLGVGNVIARKVRTVPGSPMLRIHARR